MSDEIPDRRKRRISVASSYRQADKYLTLGYQIALSMVVYVAIGLALDLFLDMLPVFTLVGAVVGFVSMMLVVLRFAKREQHPRNTDTPKDDHTVGQRDAP